MFSGHLVTRRDDALPVTKILHLFVFTQISVENVEYDHDLYISKFLQDSYKIYIFRLRIWRATITLKPDLHSYY